MKDGELFIGFKEVGEGQLVAPLHLALETWAGTCCKNLALCQKLPGANPTYLFKEPSFSSLKDILA